MVWIKRHLALTAIILFFIALNVFFYFVSPDTIVEYVGVRNSYAITFIIAAIGGLSTVTGTVLFSTIATFAAGGSNPTLLGIIGGLGIFISDSIFFHLAQLGRQFVPNKWEGWIGKMHQFVQSYPLWLVLLLVYLYISFIPLPNDILMVALVLGGYQYRYVAPILLVGSISIALVIAHLGILWF